MPDGRLRGATAYSTNKSTQANRKRLSSMPLSKRIALRKRTSEYQSIWQLLNRVSRKDEYKRANRGAQRVILQNSVKGLMDKRRREGKTMCNTDEETMIERHLKKESQARALTRNPSSSALPNLKGIAIDPSPHAMPSPPETPSEEGLNSDADEDYYDEDEAFTREGLKFERTTEDDQSDYEMQHMSDDGDQQSTRDLVSSLRSEVNRLSGQVQFLTSRFDALQMWSPMNGGGGYYHEDQYSTTEVDDGGQYHEDGMGCSGGGGPPPGGMFPFLPQMGYPHMWAAPPQPGRGHDGGYGGQRQQQNNADPEEQTAEGGAPQKMDEDQTPGSTTGPRP